MRGWFAGEITGQVDAPTLSVYSIRNRPNHVVPEHVHEYSRIGILTEGSVREVSCGEWFDYTVGTVVYWPPGSTHANRIGPSANRSVQIDVSDELLSRIGAALDVSRPWIFAAESFEGQVGQLLREVESNHGLSSLAVEGAVYSLLARAARLLHGSTVPSHEISRALALMESSIDLALGVNELAEAAQLSARCFARRFQQELGVSATEYLRSLRLGRVAKQLILSDEPVAKVAVDNGFYDAAHLSREFKRRFGRSPLAFRRECRLDPCFAQGLTQGSTQGLTMAGSEAAHGNVMPPTPFAEPLRGEGFSVVPRARSVRGS
jgi:AraC family transcriptional regulator